MADPNVTNQANLSASLYYSPALRELARQRTQAGRDYNTGKQNVDPQYTRLVQEQQYGLKGMRAQNTFAAGEANQNYDISGRTLGTTYGDQLRRTEQDAARRGLFSSGILSRQNTMLGQNYITGLSDLERARANQLGQITAQGQAGEQKAAFNVSDAQRARTQAYNDLYQKYSQTVGDVDLKNQQLREEQGQRSSSGYDTLMQEYRDYQLRERAQGTNETQFHHDAYWAQKNADEDKRRYENQRQLDAMARKAQGLAY